MTFHLINTQIIEDVPTALFFSEIQENADNKLVSFNQIKQYLSNNFNKVDKYINTLLNKGILTKDSFFDCTKITDESILTKFGCSIIIQNLTHSESIKNGIKINKIYSNFVESYMDMINKLYTFQLKPEQLLRKHIDNINSICLWKKLPKTIMKLTLDSIQNNKSKIEQNLNIKFHPHILFLRKTNPKGRPRKDSHPMVEEVLQLCKKNNIEHNNSIILRNKTVRGFCYLNDDDLNKITSIIENNILIDNTEDSDSDTGEIL